MAFSDEDKILIKMETPEFIAPDLWPPNSPDLNPVDYKVYSASLNIEAWSGITQEVFDKAIDQWTVRLQACVKAKGRHFEHML